MAEAKRLRAEGNSIQAVADAIGWSFAHTRRKLAEGADDSAGSAEPATVHQTAVGVPVSEDTDPAAGNGIPAISPVSHPSHPEHTAISPVSPLVTPQGISDIARQSDLDTLRSRVEVLEAFVATLQPRGTPVSPNGTPVSPRLTDGTPPPTTKHSFVIAVDLLDTLQRYAAAHHLEIKAALDLALRTFFAQAGEGVHGHA